MKKKLISRLSAAAMASAMLVSMFGMSVSAAGVYGGEGEDAIESVTINKTVSTDGHSYAPSETFTFNVQTAEATTFEDEFVYAGVAGGLTAGSGAAFSSDAALSSTYSATVTLSVNKEAFEGPGIYHYEVSEIAGDYAGITYDDTVYDVYVYVYGSGNSKYVGHIVSVNQDTKEKSDLEFTNDYAEKLHDLTVQKTVTGNQGDTTKPFEFSITVTGDENNEKFYMAVGDTVYTLSSGEPQGFKLSSGETAVIYGLSEGDSYVVSEDDYTTTDGYTTSNTVNGTASTEELTTGNVTMGNIDNTVIFTNDKDAQTPTGIILNIAPYIILVAFAGAAALVFFRRRNREF